MNNFYEKALARTENCLTPDTAAKALASRFNRAPLVAARPETNPIKEKPNIFAQNDTPVSIHQRVELPNAELRALAPSVFAAQAMTGVSPRYAFLPTRSVRRPIARPRLGSRVRSSTESSPTNGAGSRST